MEIETIWNELVKLVHEYKKLNIENSIDFEKFNLFSLVHHSTTIEGNTLTESETQLLLEKGLTANGKPLEHGLMTKDCYNALLHVIAESKKKTRFSSEFLKMVNSMVMKNTGSVYNHALGSFDSSKGDYRLAPAFAQGGSYYLAAEKIAEHVENLCREINSRLDLVNTIEEKYKLSFDAHFYLVIIHPWADGNGRTCRLAMNYIQRYHSLPLTKVYSTDRIEYIEALKQSKEKKDIHISRDFLCRQQIKFLNEKITEFKLFQKQSKSGGLSFSF